MFFHRMQSDVKENKDDGTKKRKSIMKRIKGMIYLQGRSLLSPGKLTFSQGLGAVHTIGI